jgi:hypothetical protein
MSAALLPLARSFCAGRAVWPHPLPAWGKPAASSTALPHPSYPPASPTFPGPFPKGRHVSALLPSGSPLGQRTSPLGRRTSPLWRRVSLLGQCTSPLGQCVSPFYRGISPMGRRVSPLFYPVFPMGQRAAPISNRSALNLRAAFFLVFSRSPDGKPEINPAPRAGIIEP